MSPDLTPVAVNPASLLARTKMGVSAWRARLVKALVGKLRALIRVVRRR